MIEALISLLLLLIVLVVVYYIAKLACDHFGAPQVILHIVGLILLLVFLIAAMRVLGVAPAGWR